MRRSKPSKSFNLIELLAVTAVLVVISGVGLPQFLKAMPPLPARSTKSHAPATHPVPLLGFPQTQHIVNEPTSTETAPPDPDDEIDVSN